MESDSDQEIGQAQNIPNGRSRTRAGHRDSRVPDNLSRQEHKTAS
uniref:Uncharacterized protein n=1 Tax=Anguilla anguilla TaxID=7936 RepID=A0A0E9QPH1_ANGAN